jgi:hypothetical protein
LDGQLDGSSLAACLLQGLGSLLLQGFFIPPTTGEEPMTNEEELAPNPVFEARFGLPALEAAVAMLRSLAGH